MTTEHQLTPPPTLYFELRYVTRDFEFGTTQVGVSDHNNKLAFQLRKRVLEDAPTLPVEPSDGFVTISSERTVSDRLYQDAVSSKILSYKREPVRQVQQDMQAYMLRTLHLIRWRANVRGRPNPIRSGVHEGFRWSFDGTTWHAVSDFVSLSLSFHVHPQWSDEVGRFVGLEAASELDEPLGHELLREAWINRTENLRSSIVLAVAAAEVGFKQFAGRTIPDCSWLLESVQSPPLVKMLEELFPWSRLKPRNGVQITIPESVLDVLRKAVLLRNGIVHGKTLKFTQRTVGEVIVAVRDLLYLLDAAEGQEWALFHLSAGARRHFPEIKFPLAITATD